MAASASSLRTKAITRERFVAARDDGSMIELSPSLII